MEHSHRADRLGQTVYHTELGVRISAGFLTAISGALAIGALTSVFAPDRDPAVLLIALFFGTMSALSARTFLMRVVADRRGIEVVSILRRRRYRWDEIQRFEVTKWRRRAVAVLPGGTRVPLIGYQMSPAERIRGSGSPTERLVDALNARLSERAPHPLSGGASRSVRPVAPSGCDLRRERHA